MAGKIQDQDIKSAAELVSAGATAASLPNDDKIYVTGNSINKTLKQAIIDGDLAGSVIPTIQIFPTAGSGTYTTPANVKFLKIKMVGGGGGGSGSGTGSGGGGGNSGGNTLFGSSLLVANGGSGGSSTFANGGSGGTTSLSSPAIGVSFPGQEGEAGQPSNSTTEGVAGGAGGSSSYFGGGSVSSFNATPNGPAANTGGGGAGGPLYAVVGYAGSGGGSGGFVDALIGSPSASYSYSVAGGGTGGSAGTSGFAGAAGADGIIIVEEYY